MVVRLQPKTLGSCTMISASMARALALVLTSVFSSDGRLPKFGAQRSLDEPSMRPSHLR